MTEPEAGTSAPATESGIELAEAAVRAFSAPRREAAVARAPSSRVSLDALLAASPDAMALVDPEGRYVHVNDQLARLTGVPRRALIGRSVQEFYPTVWDAIAPYFNAAVSADARKVLDTDEFEVALPDRGNGGEDSDLLVRVYPVTGREGRLLGLGLSLTDITVMKRSERALREANALKDEFLSIASHELRNPVAAVRGSAQLLMRSLHRGTLDEERLETYLGSILEASERLSELTGDLLDVSRLQRGQFPMRPRLAGLSALTEGFVAGHPSGSRCHLEIPDDDPCVAWVDPARYEQILGNLLDNAQKYAPGPDPIRVRLRPGEGGVLLEVRDQGMGLPPGAAEEIFRPFGRAPNATSANVPGMGLGLYICRRIAEQTDGRLWAESDGEGRGTAMLAWFPCTRSGETDDD